MSSSATLHARKSVIAAVTVFATLVLGSAVATVESASASTGVPVSTPLVSPAPSTSPTAAASPSPTATKSSKATKKVSATERALRSHHVKVRKVLVEARRQKGKPYVYGAAGPHGFDCSGLVRYVFLHALHKSLPHNAAQQYSAVKHIHRSQLKPGDLIFTDDGGYISHVGIYDGGHLWWVAPHTGTHVQRQHIYSAHFLYGRPIPMNLPKSKKAHHKK
jgi:cell wall-associated NlpC family hydrolase